MKSILYPGSFDPVTRGHIDVIKRLRKVFDRVLVLVADSPRKKYLFTSAERVGLLKSSLADNDGVVIRSSDELTVRVAQRENISVIARSVRTTSDWEYEYAMADANKKLNLDIETLFIMADSKYAFISSSLVREIAAFDGDTSQFVPQNVEVALKKKNLRKMFN
jgi:pantetheine-phosphate adenylyltransferase